MIRKGLLILLLLSLVEFNPLDRIMLGDVKVFNQLDKKGKPFSLGSRPLVILGDVQTTSFWESLLGRENNDIERKRVVNEVLKENPGRIILLGDMIFEGSNIEHWSAFDSLFKDVYAGNIPVSAVLGNHEYWGNNDAAFSNLCRRFNQFSSCRWYSLVEDSVALVFLDSNLDEYPFPEQEKQAAWFKSILTGYDYDTSIKGILVFLHHPPYTNSSLTGDGTEVQNLFLPAFNSSKKTVAMFSGHVHAYERFRFRDKTFIVSGGGGGPRVKLRTEFNIHKDLCTKSSLRPFHFIRTQRDCDSLYFEVKSIDKEDSSFYLIDKFALSLKTR